MSSQTTVVQLSNSTAKIENPNSQGSTLGFAISFPEYAGSATVAAEVSRAWASVFDKWAEGDKDRMKKLQSVAPAVSDVINDLSAYHHSKGDSSVHFPRLRETACGASIACTTPSGLGTQVTKYGVLVDLDGRPPAKLRRSATTFSLGESDSEIDSDDDFQDGTSETPASPMRKTGAFRNLQQLGRSSTA